MQALWTRAVQGLAGTIKEDQHQYKKKSVHRSEREKFTFIPDLPVNKQIDMFQKRLQSGQWNGDLQFKGYKGTFKIEYWINIEAKLRNVTRLRSISFGDTQLDKEHLTLLGKWITWMAPNRFELILKQNELDDQDVEEFVFELFKRKLRLTKLLIISNPGIYKGNLLKKLKEYLTQRYANNLRYYYQVIKDKKSKSLAIVKILRNETDDVVQNKIQKAQEQISQTFFYDLSLDQCFTKENTAAFEYLIKQCYHEDNLEQLMSLDVSNCDLGELSVFNQLCKLISTAKGLLSLSLRNQPLLKNSNVCQALMGDRYDQLRINILDISQNQTMIEKAFKVLTDNIITSSCKQFITTDSLGQHLPVIVKVYYLTEAYKAKVEELKEEMVRSIQMYKYQAKKIPKLVLKKLDMGKIENYNRHDLVIKLLLSTIYTEFSSVRILVVSNCDIGRIEAYTKACKTFKEYIKNKINNDPLYANFKPRLREVHFPKQTYRMEVQPSKCFFLECMFTKQTDLFTIETLSFTSCFKQNNREEGFNETIQELQEEIKKDPNIQYDVKSIAFQDTSMTMGKNNFDFFFFNKNLRLESFTIIQDSIDYDFQDLVQTGESFLKEIPENQFHSLKILILRDVYDFSIEISGFLRTFIYNPKMRLETLELTLVTVTAEEDKVNQLKEQIKGLNPADKLALKSLTYGEIEGDFSDEIMRYLVLSRVCQLQSLSISKIKFSEEMLNNYWQQYNEQLLEDMDCLHKLQSISLKEIKVDDKESWRKLSNLFIFNKKPTIQNVKFDSMTISSILIEGLQQSIVEVCNNFQSDRKFNKLNDLSFINCDWDNCDFLSIFLSNALCKLKNIEFIKCKNLNKSLGLFKQFQEDNNLDEINRFNIQSFTLQDTTIDDIKLFEWFMEQIIFNEKRQKLSKLCLKNCELKDPEILILARIFRRVKQFHQKEELKRYYCLKELNLGNNPQISTAAWTQLFDSLQNVNMIDNIEDSLKVDDNQYQEVQGDAYSQDCDQLLQQELKVFEKMVNQPQIYKFVPPKQLLELTLNVEYPKMSNPEKQLVYNRIIQGLIIFPGNQLQKLCLKGIDLDLFMQECQKVKQKLQIYFQKVLKTEVEIVHLKEVNVQNIKVQSEASMGQFVSMFLCNQKINLQSLIVKGANSKIISHILEQSAKRETYSLTELDLTGITEHLTFGQIVDFLKSIFLGQKFKIEKLTLGSKLTFDQPELGALIYELDNEKPCIPLKELNLSVDNSNDIQLKTYQQLFEILIGNQIKFDKLIIVEQENQSKIFDKVYGLQAKEIFIKELQVQQCELTIEFLNFLESTRRSLKSLICDKMIGTAADINSYLQNYKQNPAAQQRCKLSIKKVDDSSQFLWSSFICNKEFNFTDTTIKQFQQIQLSDYPYHLRYFNLSFGLVFNSQQQIPPNSYKIIAEKLIYNLDSQLEELVFHQCHLKIDGLKALVSPAQAFREKMEAEGLKQKVTLKLKRFNIYYSLYILDAGFDLLNPDLIYFEYINLERLELQVTNYNSYMAKGLVRCANQWLAFQKQNKRQYQQFLPIKYLDIGRNEFVDEQEAWNGLCDTFLFSKLTPRLEILNIHFMSMTDPIVDYILEKANRFFNSQSSSYVYPVKKLNYSLNTALTHEGWSKITSQFFFHPKVELIEINLNSTMLDDDLKINAIVNAIRNKALTKPNHKLKLHTFLCYNISLKDTIQEYLTQQPEGYEPPEDIPVSIDYNSANPGIIDGVPEGFGDIQQMIQSVLYKRKYFINENKWNLFDDFRVSANHLSFTDSFLRPLNEFYRNQGQTELTLYFDVKILDNLAQIFKYPIAKPGRPYPYSLIFQNEFYVFQKEKNCIISQIDISHSLFATLEDINQMDIFNMWKNLKSKKTSIDQVTIDYYLNDDLIDHMFAQGYTERDLISLVRIFPPAKIRAQNTISLQAIKAFYSIFWDAHNFTYCSFEYDFDNFLNIGIGYALREIVYNTRVTSCLGRRLKRFFYTFCNIFVSDVKKYVLDEQVQELNDYLSQQKLFFVLIAFTNLLFYTVCIVAPVYFTRYYEGDTDPVQRSKYCKSGISAYAGYAYYAFAAVTLIIEAYLYRQVSLLLSNHTEKLFEIAEDDEDEQPQTHKVVPVGDDQEKQPESILAPIALKRMRSSVKSKMNNFANSSAGMWVAYLMKIILAQLAKLDLFNDVAFILTCYYCDEIILFYLSLAVTAFNNAYYFLQYFFLVITRLRESDKTAKLISTKFINDFFSISIAGRNIALAVLLDQVAPFNVSVIPNNFITRFLIPNQAGKSINNSVKNYLFKFSCEDVPQILIQMYFIVVQAIKQNGNISWSIYLTISVSLLSLLLSFVRFMSIRPSNLTQIDFDKLSDEKNRVRPQLIQQHLKNQKSLLEDYTNLHCNQSVNLSEDQKQNESDHLLGQ